MALKLRMIDAIGPFFLDYPKARINWSKIPFENLQRNGRVDLAKFGLIRQAFSRFAATVSSMGFTAISLDDVAHLVDCPAYSRPLRERIHEYQQQYRILFDIAKQHGLQVFLTTDIAFFNAELDRLLGRNDDCILGFLAFVYPLVWPLRSQRLPEFATQQTMGIRALFR